MQFANNENKNTEITNTSDDGRKKAKEYENLATIGQGAFGVAILVRRVMDGLTLVIKKVKVGMMTEKERTDALQEVSILSKLQHPHVIAYHEAFLSDGLLNIVLDYADGGTLEDRIKSAKKNDYKYFQVNQIQCWFSQLAMGLGMSFNYFYIYICSNFYYFFEPTLTTLLLYKIIRHNRLRTSK